MSRLSADPTPEGRYPQASVDDGLCDHDTQAHPSGMTYPNIRSTEPTPLAECITEVAQHLLAMSQVDGCPLCPNVEPTRSWVPLEVGYRTAHQCTDCGHAWTQDWKD